MKKLVPICSIIGFILGIGAIVLCAVSGYQISATILGQTSVTSYSIFNLMFGCDVTVNSNGDTVANAGLIIALVLVCLRVIFSAAEVVMSNNKKSNKGLKVLVGLLAAVFFIVAGILFFCTLKLTDLSTGKVDYSIIAGEAKAGAGVYLTGIASILAGLALIPSVVSPIFSKGKKRR